MTDEILAIQLSEKHQRFNEFVLLIKLGPDGTTALGPAKVVHKAAMAAEIHNARSDGSTVVVAAVSVFGEAIDVGPPVGQQN